MISYVSGFPLNTVVTVRTLQRTTFKFRQRIAFWLPGIKTHVVDVLIRAEDEVCSTPFDYLCGDPQADSGGSEWQHKKCSDYERQPATFPYLAVHFPSAMTILQQTCRCRNGCAIMLYRLSAIAVCDSICRNWK